MNIKKSFFFIVFGILLFIPIICHAESYDRPWTSPKKAIYGGAAFIAESYIAKGQDSLYLQRYNVSPTAYYWSNNHQYATDIAYAEKQAKTMYTKYKDNDLLDSTFNFEIPVFDNMPAYTLSLSGSRVTGGIDHVVDEEFEKQLDAQGFPESYRVWLRQLHQDHPSWSFSSICTGLDFSSTANTQSTVSKIYDKSWIGASASQVAYYLDPRNFLTEKYILMFARLSYDSSFDTPTGQLLSKTFMSGYDFIDNESYASMYIGAGKTYNVNPVFLAAKTILENGTNGSIQTSGAALNYNGANYVGVYNFYSIGAADSSGAAGGVAYAANGLSSVDGVFTGNIGGEPNIINIGTNPKYTTKTTCSPNTTTPSSQQIISSTTKEQVDALGLSITNNIVSGIAINTSAASLTSKVSNIIIKDINGNAISGEQIVATGSIISFVGGESYSIVVYGDVSGDGKINSADLLSIQKHLLGTNTLSGVNLESAQLDSNNVINSADLLKLQQYLLGQVSLRIK